MTLPSSLGVRGGASVPLTVYALRRDGFTNEITLALQDAPAGFKLNGAKVPANQDQVRLTLQAPAAPTEKPITLYLEGRAVIQGHTVVHAAVPADLQHFLEVLVPVGGKRVDGDDGRNRRDRTPRRGPLLHVVQESSVAGRGLRPAKGTAHPDR